MTNSDSPENKGRDAKGRFGPGNPGGTGGSRRRAEARKIIEEAVPAEFLKGLANPHRLLVLCALSKGERSVGELIAQTGMSGCALQIMSNLSRSP